MLEAHRVRSGRLASLYEDGDGARAEEVASMSGSTVFSSFYDQLKAIREYHRKFPGDTVTETNEQMLLTEVLESAPDDGFTGEESEGRYVDMHTLHELYLNLKGVERIDYTTYLKRCADLSSIPQATTSLCGA